MGELHATDKSVVIEAFAPIRQLKKPTTYSIAFHNGQAILRTADTLMSIGIEEAIELSEMDLCVDKGIHEARYQAWLEYSHAELKKLTAADELAHPTTMTKLEEQAGTELGQAQLELELDFSLIFCRFGLIELAAVSGSSWKVSD